MPSSVTEEDIKRLREARYLTTEISHPLPARGQVIPTPEPNESIVFVSHFLRGLGLALSPDSFLHISSFIVVCAAFLRITPHFGMWLKKFDVKPKMIER